MADNKVKYPKGFLFGTATSAYQIEGAWNEDGKGENVWDRYVHSGNHCVYQDHTGDVAIDHYHRYEEDFDILKDLNTNAYRFSISWARIFPEGKGKINQKGIDFYNNVINALIKRGIEPAITLFHWDLPSGLQALGGWENREIVKWFTDYAKVCFENFGDRVKYWFTINEPVVFTKRAYGLGLVPPCGKDTQAGVDAAHNALLAHGEAVKLFRKMNMQGKIGLALDIVLKVPATDKPEDIEAAERSNGMINMWFYDAVVKGKYPELALKEYAKRYVYPKILPGDMETISQKLDFIGLNYYLTQLVEDKKGNGHYDIEIVRRPELKRSDMNWELAPEGLMELLRKINKDTGGIPICISENGWSVTDTVDENGEVHDPDRVMYLEKHLEVVEQAIAEGIPVESYFLWSAFDNFEWNVGYAARFGIVYVDYETQKRTVKDSGKWYSKYILDHKA